MNLKSYLFFIVIFIAFTLICGMAMNDAPEAPDAEWKDEMSELETRLNAPTVLSLEKGRPVGTLRINGEDYVIYTTNEDDRSR